jgi:trans-aconitate 2-methyltransferase
MMSETTWDPTQYARFGEERGRPFRDLLARVGVSSPGVVVDLGCGNGPLTLTLADRWPHARVIGVDHSPEMLTAARDLDAGGRADWVEADLATWDPARLDAPADVVVTNATLQWVPTHLGLIDRVVGALAPQGWFAMQVPDNLDAPSHALMREVAAAHPRADALAAAVRRLQVEPPQAYLERLAALGCDVDVWSTTYFHVLDPEGQVEDPVLEWVRGTGLRPVLAVLTDVEERDEFVSAYRLRLREAYPRTAAGVVLPFRRTFAVAHKRDRRV